VHTCRGAKVQRICRWLHVKMFSFADVQMCRGEEVESWFRGGAPEV